MRALAPLAGGVVMWIVIGFLVGAALGSPLLLLAYESVVTERRRTLFIVGGFCLFCGLVVAGLMLTVEVVG